MIPTRRARLIACCFGLLLVGAAPVQASSGIQLIGGCDTPGEAFSVALSGNYAYVADGDSGLRVISIADPAHPVEVGSFDTPGWAHGVAVSGNYAYVAAYDSGLRVISVADPSHPVEVGHCNTPRDAYAVAASGNYAYVADYDSAFRVISVADPSHPVEVGSCTNCLEASSVTVVGSYAYIADGLDGVRVFSVADPANPATVGGYNRIGVSFIAAAVDGDFACGTTRDSGLVTLSLSDSFHMTRLGRYGWYKWPWGVAASHGYVYVAADEAGLRVLSVADPAHPTEVGFYDAPNWWANGVTVNGGYVYVAYGMAGLQIFQALGGIEEETMSDEREAMSPGPSIVRGVLLLPGERGRETGDRAALLDASGRKVADLRCGANDVSRLAPGVYFMRSAVGGERSAVTKVVVAR